MMVVPNKIIITTTKQNKNKQTNKRKKTKEKETNKQTNKDIKSQFISTLLF